MIGLCFYSGAGYANIFLDGKEKSWKKLLTNEMRLK